MPTRTVQPLPALTAQPCNKTAAMVFCYADRVMQDPCAPHSMWSQPSMATSSAESRQMPQSSKSPFAVSKPAMLASRASRDASSASGGIVADLVLNLCHVIVACEHDCALR